MVKGVNLSRGRAVLVDLLIGSSTKGGDGTLDSWRSRIQIEIADDQQV